MPEPKPHSAAAPALPQEAGAPSFAVKLIVSLLVVFHLTCIVINVTAAGQGAYQAPPVLVKACARDGIVRGWLGMLFQTNAYRFYAPDPGPCDLLWARFKYADPDDPRKEVVAARWREIPNREEHPLRMPYQRDLAICMLLNMHVEPMPNSEIPNGPSPGLHFGELGRICFSSYIRHLASAPGYGTLAVAGFKKPLVLIGIDAFKVAHNILSPNDVKLGLDYPDPRLYSVFFLGRYGVDGKRDGPEDEPFVPQNMDDLFARIVQDDLLPAAEQQQLKADDREGRRRFIRAMGLPKPFRPALDEDPGYLTPGQTRAVLAKRFADQVQQHDDPAMKVKLGLVPNAAGQRPFNLPQASGPFRPDQSLQNRVAPPNRGAPSPNVR